MRRTFVFAVNAILTTVLTYMAPSNVLAEGPASTANSAFTANDIANGYASTHVIVRIRNGRTDPRKSTGDDFSNLCTQWGVATIRPAFSFGFANKVIAAQKGLDRTFVIEVPSGTDTAKMALAFRNLVNHVEFAEVDGIGGVAGLIPNDPNFPTQYGMHNTGQNGGVVDADIDAPEAWNIYTGSLSPVTVATIDSGVTPHDEFAGRMVPGINTSNPATPNLTTDGCGPHGTHVAGIIAARGNNGIGVAGLNWGARIMPVRVVNGCSGTELQCAEGIVWAVDHGATVINLSVQYYTGTQALEDAVDYAHSQGVVLVAAAGNFQGNVVAFPARFPHCMAVTATNRFDGFAGFSNYGQETDLCAPGDDIWSTSNTNGYALFNGTSMASPHVAGVASLLRSLIPSLSNDQITNLLIYSTDDLGPTGWDNHFGTGRLNAQAALLAGLSIGACCNGDECIDLGEDQCAILGGQFLLGSICDGDVDQDGVDASCGDDCSNDPNKTTPGLCGCGILEDTGNDDNDSCINCLDACPGDFYKCSPGICGCGVDDTDRDGDGIPDCNDPIARIFLVSQDGDPDPGVTLPAGENISLVADGGDVLRFEAWLEATPGFNLGGYQVGWPCSFGFSATGAMNYNSICLGTDCAAFPSSPRVNRNQPLWAMSGLQTGSGQDQGMCPLSPPRTAITHWIQPPHSNYITTPRYLAEIQYTVSMDAKGSTKVVILKEAPTSLAEDPTDFRVPFVDDGVTVTIRTGRCCVPDACLDDVTRRECESAGGMFRADATCAFDFDQDGTADCNEDCPFDPNKVVPGICGCGVSDANSDMDGLVDCIEECDTDPNKYFPGLCGCGVSDVDTDGDTVPDCNDVCPDGDDTIDSDNDGQPDCVGAPIPTTTTWGLIALTLLLLCGAQVLVRSGRRACN